MGSEKILLPVNSQELAVGYPANGCSVVRDVYVLVYHTRVYANDFHGNTQIALVHNGHIEMNVIK